MYQYEIKIPKDRIAVLIGVKGKIKKEIESVTNSKLNIDSKEGDVSIKGDDSIGLMTAKDVIYAVGRGFNPEIALRLLKPDYCLEIIEISDFARKSRKDEKRLKGRVIGADGKSRKTIEFLTETNMSVYGKTVAIIGEISRAMLAKRAIEDILQGSPHSKVYSWLEKKRKELRTEAILATEKRKS